MTTSNKAWVVLIFLLAWLVSPARSQEHGETLLSTDNAYNPIPSPDGKYIAYVRTGWGRPAWRAGVGRSNMISETVVTDTNGTLVGRNPVADTFLSGWTPDGALVCYRDGEYFLASVDGKHSNNGRVPGAGSPGSIERVSYLSRSGTMIWSRPDEPFHTVLETPKRVVAQQNGWQGELIAPSPNGRYLAIAGGWSQKHLWVYDTELNSWTYLGDAEIHPDENWDYIKPSWNPWFADSSRLAYFTHDNSVLSISTSDGKRRTDIQIDRPAGLASPSPDGKSIAYVTFEPRPRKERPDLQFWGGTQVWVFPLDRPQPRPVTSKSPDETYDLRWLGDHTLVFDRVADVRFYKQSRIWKVDVTH